jgi:hypothetical protein
MGKKLRVSSEHVAGEQPGHALVRFTRRRSSGFAGQAPERGITAP